MAGTSKVVVKTNSVRECRFYMRYIANNFRVLNRENIVDNFSDTEICCRIINQHIRYVHSDVSSIDECIRVLEIQYLKTIISDDNFLWLKQNKRATFWVWGNLALKGFMNGEINKFLGTDLQKHWYSDAKLSLSPINHEQRFNLVIDTVDFICSFSTDYASKMIVWLNNKLIEWRESQGSIINIPWLTPENERECFWAYNYMKDHQEKNKASSDNILYPVSIPIPLDSEEAYLSFYAMHDLWDVDINESYKVNERMSKTRSQNEYRRRKAEKNMLSEISPEGVEKLKFLSDFYKSTKVQVLDTLISERYRGIQIRINAQDQQT